MTIVAVGILVLAGYFPARLLTGTRWAAALVAPLAAALLLTVFALPCAAARLPLAVAMAATLVTAGASAWAVRRRGTPRPGPADSPWVLAIPLGALLPFLTVGRAPVGWDARSIWWFHARWWAEGPTALVDALRNPAFAFTHPDYPPLPSVTVGALWSLTGSHSFALAQVVTATCSLSAAATLGYAIWRLFAGRLPTGGSTAAAVVVVAAAYGLVGVTPATDGYVDFLWAGTFAAAAVFLLATPPCTVALRWGAVLMATAALTKHEALIASVLLGVLAIMRYRNRFRIGWWVAVALAPGLAWPPLVRVLGARSEDRWRANDLLRLDPSVTDRIGPTVASVWHEVAAMTLVTLLLTVLGLAYARNARRTTSGTAAPWLWAAWGATVGPLALAYVLSNRDLHWHLASSVTRTTIAPNLVLLAECAVWTLTCLVAWRESAPATVTPSDPVPAGADT